MKAKESKQQLWEDLAALKKQDEITVPVVREINEITHKTSKEKADVISRTLQEIENRQQYDEITNSTQQIIKENYTILNDPTEE